MRRAIGSRPLFLTVMGLLALIYAFPLLWMAWSSFKTNREIFTSPLALPQSIDFSVWGDAWQVGNLGRYALNSALVTATAVLVILLLAAMAAYAFSRFEFKGRGVLLGLFAFGLLLPIQSYFIAQNSLFEWLDLKDTRLALIIPYSAMGLSLAVYLLKVYLDSLPKELFEAARVDGCSDTRMFTVLVLPLLRPGLATVAIFSALNAWNEFLLALLYVTNDALKTIPTGLLAFSSRYVTDYQLLFAALTIVTLPMVAVYVVFHRQIVAGVTEGSLK
jgi:raffinose/stachyose/melibiose transport system permease protein